MSEVIDDEDALKQNEMIRRPLTRGTSSTNGLVAPSRKGEDTPRVRTRMTCRPRFLGVMMERRRLGRELIKCESSYWRQRGVVLLSHGVKDRVKYIGSIRVSSCAILLGEPEARRIDHLNIIQ